MLEWWAGLAAAHLPRASSIQLIIVIKAWVAVLLLKLPNIHLYQLADTLIPAHSFCNRYTSCRCWLACRRAHGACNVTMKEAQVIKTELRNIHAAVAARSSKPAGTHPAFQLGLPAAAPQRLFSGASIRLLLPTASNMCSYQGPISVLCIRSLKVSAEVGSMGVRERAPGTWQQQGQ